MDELKETFIEEKREAKYFIKGLAALKITRIVLIVTFVLLVSPYILFLALKPKEAPNIKFGVTYSPRYARALGLDWRDSYIKILDDLSVKKVRIPAYWDDIEAVKGQFNFDEVKFLLEEADKRDIEVIMAIGRKVPRYPECYEPAWLRDSPQEEKDEALYNFIQVSIKSLKSYTSIKTWQIENEPFFPFGTCNMSSADVLKREVYIAKSEDQSRKILIQDSGEGGLWRPTFNEADILGISMYRKVWFDFWGLVTGLHTYFQYPLGHDIYKIKANILGIPLNKIVVTELQAEPWGPGFVTELSQAQKDESMSKQDFIETIGYAHSSGFNEFYLWGVEWWLWEKEKNGNGFFWDSAKALIQNQR